jgi:hypothetical protein
MTQARAASRGGPRMQSSRCRPSLEEDCRRTFTVGRDSDRARRHSGCSGRHAQPPPRRNSRPNGMVRSPRVDSAELCDHAMTQARAACRAGPRMQSSRCRPSLEEDCRRTFTVGRDSDRARRHTGCSGRHAQPPPRRNSRPNGTVRSPRVDSAELCDHALVQARAAYRAGHRLNTSRCRRPRPRVRLPPSTFVVERGFDRARRRTACNRRRTQQPPLPSSQSHGLDSHGRRRKVRQRATPKMQDPTGRTPTCGRLHEQAINDREWNRGGRGPSRARSQEEHETRSARVDGRVSLSRRHGNHEQRTSIAARARIRS